MPILKDFCKRVSVISASKLNNRKIIGSILDIDIAEDHKGKGLFINRASAGDSLNNLARIISFTSTDGRTLPLDKNFLDFWLVAPAESEPYFQVKTQSTSKPKLHDVDFFSDDQGCRHFVKKISDVETSNNLCLVAQRSDGQVEIVYSQNSFIKAPEFFNSDIPTTHARQNNSMSLGVPALA